MSPITTHVLDTALGQPAAGIAVRLERQSAQGPVLIAQGTTDVDGRIMDWSEDHFSTAMQAGEFIITFAVDDYHQGQGFFPVVSIPFRVTDAQAHYHVPLLLSPFSFSTYRGS
ncbi:hydroxyisourate hydrolase [Marinicella meishanensis]|uniref:hydroxyisourate hydrolase n=1 Tax=Marinicella meishanensis TaxID=2873263 RepID=UPI001CBD9F0C|nr:hydroxyisourate hydrolase [Marinicella sp. NBU2979]